jgi:hypothetical protein
MVEKATIPHFNWRKSKELRKDEEKKYAYQIAISVDGN